MEKEHLAADTRDRDDYHENDADDDDGDDEYGDEQNAKKNK